MPNISFPDQPDVHDKLGASSFVEGMVDFLKECETPLTLSIRGSWGTGKTSLLKQISEKLPKRTCKTMWFNTWQFSQTGFEDNMTVPCSHPF